MQKRFFITLLFYFFICTSFHLYAQNDPVLFTVGNEEITKSEFLKIFNKNNIKGEPLTKMAIEEYLELYINFKLKVKEAEALGLDTLKSFKDELAGYRAQLAQPYFVDKKTDSLLIREAYDRMLWDLRASHIFVKLDPDALPEDTLEKYNHIMSLRKRIMKGESFEKVAIQASEDPTARDQEATDNHPFFKGNAGDLGYFTVFDLVYPFETAAYNLKIGEVSMPVRTEIGYHLIKLYDRKKALGKVQVAHILISIPQGKSKSDSIKYKIKADSIYHAILNGADFAEMAKKFSDDKGSSSNGGVLPWFGCFRMIPEFIIAVSDLKNKGDMPKPVLTDYGWHIITLVDKKEIGSFEEELPDIKNRIQRDSRSEKSRQVVINRIKKEYGFYENKDALKDFYKIVNDSVFKGKWDINLAAGLNKIMFSIDDKSYNQQDFAKHLNIMQKSARQQNIISFINNTYKNWVDEKCIEYEDQNLENKYPDFKDLMKEYRDGILLFNITDQKVWTKAVKDTTGLKSFYEMNKYKYMWQNRVDASIYTCANEKVAKTVKKLVKKGISNDSIMKKINVDTPVLIEIKSGKFQKGDNPVIDNIEWKKGITPFKNIDGKVVFVNIKNVLPAQPKELKEIKGLITAEYQKKLDEEWIKELRGKYKYTVNYEVLNSIFNN